MIVNVRMLAFHDGIIRPVDVPDREIVANMDGVIGLLALVYHYGQNDFIQGQNSYVIRTTICSVSVGDVIELPDHGNHLVVSFGFRRLDDTAYAAYKAMPRRDRPLYAYGQRGDDLASGEL